MEHKTEVEYAEDIKASADRLVSLCKLQAPEIIIEGERRLLFKRLINFPVYRTAQAKREQLDIAVSQKEQDYLLEHGYYNDIDGDVVDFKGE